MRLSPEAKVGLFVLLGLILLVYMSLKVGGIRLGKGEGYDLVVRFDNVGGLDVDAPVRVAGVEVGRVKEIRLEDTKARVVLRIFPEVKIRKDFTAVIKTQGLLGEKFVELIPGRPGTPPIEPGGEIKKTITYADFERLVSQLSTISQDVKRVTESLSDVLGGKEGEARLRRIVENTEEISTNLEEFSRILKEEGPAVMENLKVASRSLREVIEENRGNLRETLSTLRVASVRLEKALSSFTDFTEKVTPKLDATIDAIRSVAEKVDKGEGTIGRLVNDATTVENLNRTLKAFEEFATDVKPRLEEAVVAVRDVAEKINKGEGTIGRLVNDETTVENLNKALGGVNQYIRQGERYKTFISARGEYLFDAGDSKNYVSLRIQPRADKYYLLEVVDDPRNRVRYHEKGLREPADKVTFSAQIAKRFKNLTVRGGLIESEGGIGLDYYMFRDRLRLTFEASDFDDDRGPFLKASATYYLNKYFFLTGGYTDIASKEGLESPFIGLGLRFEDEDIKYLLLNAPIP